MLKIENVITPTPEQMLFVIQGMRNPLNSWDKSDSQIVNDQLVLGKNDNDLMRRLCKAGPEHRKFMRQMYISMRITAPLYWWKEFETYRVGITPNPCDISINSCSTMHTITKKEFTIDDFSHEHLIVADDVNHIDMIGWLQKQIDVLNEWRKTYIDVKDSITSAEDRKKYWWQIIQLLPSSYNQTRNIVMTYEAGVGMLRQRHNHKLDEWNTLEYILSELEYSGFMLIAAGLW